MKDENYLKMKRESTMIVRDSHGRPVARYKPGVRVQDSKGEFYEVQGDGSWKKVV